MDNALKTFIEGLHPLERKVLPHLAKLSAFDDIVEASGLKDVEVMRALQWLSNKHAVTVSEELKEVVELGDNGKDYLKNGLPEKRILESLPEDSFIDTNTLFKKAHVKEEETNICIGLLKKNSTVLITKEGNKLMLKKTPGAKFFLEKIAASEHFLKKHFPIDLKSISKEEKSVFDDLKSRKDLIRTKQLRLKTISLTELGKKAVKQDIKSDVEDKLTASLIKTGSWKGKKFRRYDVSINVPKVFGGKRHFVNQSVDYIKKIWLELGFKEMTGSMVQTSFWDLDALFVPQDHPARQMQDTFYIKNPAKGKLPPLWKKVKEVHENGGDTGSKGWGGKWSKDIAEENLLRTHTTVLSAQTIAKLKESDLPAKFFSVGKVFRNESLDYKHLFEFYQVEGIVIDPNANMVNLKGYLREFFLKMGFLDVRIRPAHFPYTEPSAEVEVLHPVHKEWIELGGAGIFRPEVTKTLIGKEIPVLAWGLGMGRIISEYWKITDIRDLDKNDIKQLRDIKYWMK